MTSWKTLLLFRREHFCQSYCLGFSGNATLIGCRHPGHLWLDTKNSNLRSWITNARFTTQRSGLLMNRRHQMLRRLSSSCPMEKNNCKQWQTSLFGKVLQKLFHYLLDPSHLQPSQWPKMVTSPRSSELVKSCCSLWSSRTDWQATKWTTRGSVEKSQATDSSWSH